MEWEAKRPLQFGGLLCDALLAQAHEGGVRSSIASGAGGVDLLHSPPGSDGRSEESGSDMTTAAAVVDQAALATLAVMFPPSVFHRPHVNTDSEAPLPAASHSANFLPSAGPQNRLSALWVSTEQARPFQSEQFAATGRTAYFHVIAGGGDGAQVAAATSATGETETKMTSGGQEFAHLPGPSPSLRVDKRVVATPTQPAQVKHQHPAPVVSAGVLTPAPAVEGADVVFDAVDTDGRLANQSLSDGAQQGAELPGDAGLANRARLANGAIPNPVEQPDRGQPLAPQPSPSTFDAQASGFVVEPRSHRADRGQGAELPTRPDNRPTQGDRTVTGGDHPTLTDPSPVSLDDVSKPKLTPASRPSDAPERAFVSVDIGPRWQPRNPDNGLEAVKPVPVSGEGTWAGAPGAPLAQEPQLTELPPPMSRSQPTPSLSLAGEAHPPGFIQELVQRIRFDRHEGDDGVLHVHLRPNQLGELQLRLTFVEGDLNARFMTPHEHLRALLEAHMVDLRTTLSQQGLSVGQVSVELMGNGADFRNDSRNAWGTENHSTGRGSKSAVRQVVASAGRTRHTADWTQWPLGAVDLRV